MLVRFAVENFMSFGERQVLSMMAGKHVRHSEQVFTTRGKRILKGTFIFGANASGKSNFVKAVHWAKIVAMTDVQTSGITNMHFRLSPEWASKPGVFQFDILAGGSFYSYGFALSYQTSEIISEWLYEVDDKDETLVFERETVDHRSKIKSPLALGAGLAERFGIYAEDLPAHKTFLSEIAGKTIIEAKEMNAFRNVWVWLKNLAVVLPNSKLGLDWVKPLAGDEGFIDLLKSLDTGIKGIEYREESASKLFERIPEIERDRLLSSLLEQVRRKPEGKLTIVYGDNAYSLREKDGGLAASRLYLDHGNPNDLFSLSDESDGTRRLFDILPLLDNPNSPRVMLVDEIDRNFHTNLIIRLVKHFFEKSEGQDTQLIATLHDVNLMDLDILRQDEIWFIHRNSDSGKSSLYSLNRYQIRFDKKLVKDYLLGRFGGVPNFSEMEEGDDDE